MSIAMKADENGTPSTQDFYFQPGQVGNRHQDAG